VVPVAVGGGLMPNARVRRGKDTQNRLAEYLAAHGWPHAQSTGSGRNGSDVTGTPGISWECKARSDFNPVGWLKQAQQSAGLPIAVYRPNGVGPHPDKFIAMVPLSDLVPLLLAAGYGGYDPNPTARQETTS